MTDLRNIFSNVALFAESRQAVSCGMSNPIISEQGRSFLIEQLHRLTPDKVGDLHSGASTSSETQNTRMPRGTACMGSTPGSRCSRTSCGRSKPNVVNPLTDLGMTLGGFRCCPQSAMPCFLSASRNIAGQRTDERLCRCRRAHPPGSLDDVVGTDAWPIRPRVRLGVWLQHAA
jgi:hypothetical protein